MTAGPPGTRPALAAAGEVAALAGQVLCAPAHLTVLKHKPGRRCTWRADSPAGSAIVKAYASDRAVTVAARLTTLAAGPDEPAVPRVLHVDRCRRLVVLTEVPGLPLTGAVLSGDLRGCRRAGAALARWHRWWHERPAAPLAGHTADAELAALDRQLTRLPADRRRSLAALATGLAHPWPCPTVVHRDLYEEQVVLGPRVGLIDLDDAATGPPELDLGNLAAHLQLLALRRSPAVVREGGDALLDAYRAHAPVDADRFERCRRLSLLRLAAIHGEDRLVALVGGGERQRP